MSISIAVPPDRVYAFAADPLNLPRWAAGLGASIGKVDGRWVVETVDGPATIEFAPRNPFGVLDHTVTLPSGLAVFVPIRVIPNAGGSEVLFTVFQLPGMSDEKLAEDAGLVQRDLETLKRVVEAL